MWYGYVVSSTLKGVTQNYQLIQGFKTLYPYMKFRKFRYKDDALIFSDRNGRKEIDIATTQYGSTFKNHYVRVDYIISENKVYYNIDTTNLGYVKLHSTDINITIENRVDSILVVIDNIQLNNMLITSHLVAIYQVLDLLGNYVDVDILLPDESLFYTLTQYKGTKSNILRVLRYISNRDGEVSYTVGRKY